VKLLYVERAKVTWIFDTHTINPKGLDIQPLINGLKRRFGFGKFPAHALDRNENALVFEAGSFINSGGESIAVSLNTYSDGVVAETASNTTDILLFLEQLSSTIIELGFSLPSDGIGEVGFVSQLRVVCEKPLLAINPKLAQLSDFLDVNLSSLDGKPRKFEFGGIQFLSEDISKPFSPVPFKFERKYGVSFSENEYFTQAPLQTDEHLDLLEGLEKLLAS
jgi:hypothetical protein